MIRLLVGAVIAIAGCAVYAEEEPLSVEAVLQETLDEGAYTETTNCVRNRQIRRIVALDEKHLLLFGSHNRAWLNRLNTSCSGIDRKNMIIMLDQYGSRVCANDFAYARDRNRNSFDNFRDDVVSYASRCRLGEFEQMDHQSAEMVRQAYEQARTSSKESQEGET